MQHKTMTPHARLVNALLAMVAEVIAADDATIAEMTVPNGCVAVQIDVQTADDGATFVKAWDGKDYNNEFFVTMYSALPQTDADIEAGDRINDTIMGWLTLGE